MNKDKYCEMFHFTAFLIEQGQKEAKKTFSLTGKESEENFRAVNPIIELFVTSLLEVEYGKKTTYDFLKIFQNETEESIGNHIKRMISNGDITIKK